MSVFLVISAECVDESTNLFSEVMGFYPSIEEARAKIVKESMEKLKFYKDFNINGKDNWAALNPTWTSQISSIIDEPNKFYDITANVTGGTKLTLMWNGESRNRVALACIWDQDNCNYLWTIQEVQASELDVLRK